MYVASDSDLRASLLLADERYDRDRVDRVEQRRADWRYAQKKLEAKHALDENT